MKYIAFTILVFVVSINNLHAAQSLPYATLLCKFPDESNVQPNATTYFEEIFGNDVGALNHYWKEVSSDNINLDGSFVGGWFDMPHSSQHYETMELWDALDALAIDCSNAADSTVDFSTIHGINFVFNRYIDQLLSGGTGYLTLGGVFRLWPMMWMTDSPGDSDSATLAHEIGHSLGLPHSNNSNLTNDPYDDPYDNPWTNMSRSVDGYPIAGFGFVGQHLNSYEKNFLGWIAPSELYTHETGTVTIDIDPLHFQIAGPSAYRTAIVPTSGPDIDYYTIEVRQNGPGVGVYEEYLPDTGVIIHSVDEARPEPSWLVEESPTLQGGIWKVGEIFEDIANGIKIEVVAATANGFQVKIAYIATDEFCNGEAVTVRIGNGESPTSSDDVILGTAGNDTIFAMGGNDTICSLGGDDNVNGGRGMDWIDAGAGNDTVQGANDDDDIYGDTGNDTLYGGPGNDTISGESGDDFIKGNSGNDTIDGGDGVDKILGGSGDDTIYVGAGSNIGTTQTVTGGNGNDTIYGGPDADEIRAEAGDDIINGGAGNDRLFGGGGVDTINGDSGDDLLRGNAAADTLSGGDGNDQLDGLGGNDLLYGGQGMDILNGSTGNDMMFGQGGDDSLNGGGGNDLLNGGDYQDSCDGAGGNADTTLGCEVELNIP